MVRHVRHPNVFLQNGEKWMRFVKTRTGLVNLAHVAEIRTRKVKLPADQVDPESLRNEATVYTLLGADHQELGETRYLDPEDLLRTIIPASAGAFVYLVTEEDGKIEVSQASVLAWKIGDGDPEPILLEDAASNQTMLIPQPDGSVVQQYDRYFTSIEAALAQFRREVADKNKG